MDDEVERALASMRAGFLSGTEQIAANVTSLEEHLADAPPEEREAVHAAIARLVAAHERLIGKVQHLPPSSWDQFKVMVSVVKAQQTVLDEVSHLVKEHVLPRQLESLSSAPFDDAPAGVPEPEPDEGPFASESGYGALAGAGLARSPNGVAHGQVDEPMRAAQHRAARGRTGGSMGGPMRGSMREPARAPAHDSDDETEHRSLLQLVRERTAGFRGVAAMILAGVILSVFPRDMRLQDVAERLGSLVRSASLSMPAQDGARGGADDRTAAAAPRAAERVPSVAAADVASDEERAPAAKRPEPRQAAVAPTTPARVPPASRAAAVAEGDDRPAAGPRPSEKRVATAAAVSEPVAPPAAAPAEEQFVPVVFTHKDYETVMQAFADLKQQYPSLLIGRKGEVQPVDLGKKGIYHRLVFLPPGPRPQAAKLCDQLAAQGYDRCWVKSY